MVYPALLPLMRTSRLPVVDWTDAPADLNGFVRFAERRNLVSARVPTHFNWSLNVTIRSTLFLRFSVHNNNRTQHSIPHNTINWHSQDTTALRPNVFFNWITSVTGHAHPTAWLPHLKPTPRSNLYSRETDIIYVLLPNTHYISCLCSIKELRHVRKA